jgi:hypothetical protein
MDNKNLHKLPVRDGAEFSVCSLRVYVIFQLFFQVTCYVYICCNFEFFTNILVIANYMQL